MRLILTTIHIFTFACFVNLWIFITVFFVHLSGESTLTSGGLVGQYFSLSLYCLLLPIQIYTRCLPTLSMFFPVHRIFNIIAHSLQFAKDVFHIFFSLHMIPVIIITYSFQSTWVLLFAVLTRWLSSLLYILFS